MTELFGKILGVVVSVWAAQAPAQNVAFTQIREAMGRDAFGGFLGVAAGDYDQDGDEDLYFSRQNASNVLLENLGNDQFREVTTAAGVGTTGLGFSAVWGDIDNDGDLDLFSGIWQRGNRLFLNNGNKTFNNITAQAGLERNTNTCHVLMADVDNDGFLDIYLTSTDDGNALFRNGGDGRFMDVTAASGAGYRGRAMAAGFFDHDKDGDVDLYLVHDYAQANNLYQNDGTGRFVDVAPQAGVNFAGEGMGVDFGDYNNDGWLDLYVTNKGPNLMYLNNGDGSFRDVTQAAGVGDPGMGWGCNSLDVDNDGWLDIFVANQSQFWQMLPQIFPSVLYRNRGDASFVNAASQAGLATTYDSFGSAVLDFNNDGWLDIVTANHVVSVASSNEFHKNLGGANHWLNVHLEGTVSNRSAIGARIEAFAGEWRRVDEVRAGSSYNSQNSLTVELGLGLREKVDSLLVYWPSGLKERYLDVAANQIVRIVETRGVVTGVDHPEISQAAPDFALLQNYPNPFNPSTTIRFTLPEASEVTLNVYDLTSRNVVTVPLGTKQAGVHETIFAAAQLPSGIYLYRLLMTSATTRRILATRYGKMVLMR